MAEERTARGKRKVRVGTVLKDRMHKGIVVWVERKMRHPLYEKVMVSGKKYYVHDENNDAHVGDVVEISETKPISKLKRWRLLRVVRSAPRMDEVVQTGGEEEQLG